MQYKLTGSIEYFTRYFFKKRFGRKFVVGDHHKKIFNILDRVLSGELKRVIINMPPRYGKTEVCVKNFISMGLAINPSSKFIHLSYSDDLALDNSEEVRDLVKSEEYQHIFPYVQVKKTSDSKKKWYTTYSGGVYATSAAGQVTGFGAGNVDLEDKELSGEIDKINNNSVFGGAIIIDDPIKPEDATSMTIRDRVNARFDSTIVNRVNSRNTPIVIIMQRLHPDDLCGYLIGRDGDEWYVLSLPALYFNENGEECALWSFKQTVEELKDMRKKNEIVFDTQYQQDPQPKEGLMFPLSELHFYNPSAVNLSEADYKIMWGDPADKGDDFACFVGYVMDGYVYVPEFLCNNNGLDYMIPAVSNMAMKHKPTDVCLEGNGGWIQTCKDIRNCIQENDGNIRVAIYKEKGNKEEKISGQAYFVINNFYFREDYRDMQEYAKAIKNLTSYLKNVKDQKDDVPDVLASASRYLRRNVIRE
ncbi:MULTISPECIES: hypothetical protein [Butyricimonas]|uniref:hypothetical protein n=1 Tax=Butyricimonas TaxID=574697 RepID=UPI0011DE4CE7|nr:MULTISPECIES: hypothetical protein [Butyricimonas]